MEPMSRVERAGLCNTALEVGPDAPTLCEGWDVRDLVVHLLVRERDVLGAPGIVVPPLARLTERASKALHEQDFTALVERVRSGPPLWNPMRLAPVDRIGNTVEFFVHHEDIRRAQPDWEARQLTDRDQATLFKILGGMSRGLLRGAGPVVLRTPGGREVRVGRGDPASTAVVSGPPAELLLFAFGRDAAAEVTLSGDDDAVRRLRSARRGF